MGESSTLVGASHYMNRTRVTDGLGFFGRAQRRAISVMSAPKLSGSACGSKGETQIQPPFFGIFTLGLVGILSFRAVSPIVNPSLREVVKTFASVGTPRSS